MGTPTWPARRDQERPGCAGGLWRSRDGCGVDLGPPFGPGFVGGVTECRQKAQRMLERVVSARQVAAGDEAPEAVAIAPRGAKQAGRICVDGRRAGQQTVELRSILARHCASALSVGP